MKFRFIWIGKTKEKNWRALQLEYWSRLSHFAKLELNEIKESLSYENKEIEGRRILENLKPETFVVLLDVEGKAIDSHELAAQLENWQNRSLREIVFVIGGQDGVSNEVLQRANFNLSLSQLTLTHETARVILLELLYRGYTIIHNFPYQK